MIRNNDVGSFFVNVIPVADAHGHEQKKLVHERPRARHLVCVFQFCFSGERSENDHGEWSEQQQVHYRCKQGVNSEKSAEYAEYEQRGANYLSHEYTNVCLGICNSPIRRSEKSVIRSLFTPLPTCAAGCSSSAAALV